MQNMMPQLNLTNRSVQQPRASQSSGRTGKPSQKDRFRDLLQNSPGKNSPKETAAENNAAEDSKVMARPSEKTGKPEKTQPSDTREQPVRGKTAENAKEDGTVAEEALLYAGMQMFQLLLDSSPEELQPTGDSGSILEAVPEIAEETILPVNGGDSVMEVQAVPLEELSVQAEIGRETAGVADVIASGMQETQAAEAPVLPAGRQEERASARQAAAEPVQKAAAPEQPVQTKAPVQQSENPAYRGTGTEQPGVDSQEETDHSDSLAYSAGNVWQQNFVQEPALEAAEVQPTVHIQAENTQELINQLVQQLRDKVSVGNQEFEIQIHPENLGRLAIKVAYAAEKVTISIVCSNEKTMAALSAGAKNIAMIMEENLGTPTTVVVDQQEGNYLEQYKDQQNSQHQQQKQKEKEKPTSEENQDFLQQLRLGLI